MLDLPNIKLLFRNEFNKSNVTGFSLSIDIKINLKSHFHIENYSGHIEEILVGHTSTNIPTLLKGMHNRNLDENTQSL